MKKILVLLALILTVSCSSKNDSKQLYTIDEPSGVKVIPKYEVGDVVYLKPDSTKVVIITVYIIKTTPEYLVKKDVMYYDSERISERLIY